MTTTLLVHREGKHLAHVCRDPAGRQAVCGRFFRLTDDGWHRAPFASFDEARIAAKARGNGLCRRCEEPTARAGELDAAIAAVTWALGIVALSSATQSGLHSALRLLEEMKR